MFLLSINICRSPPPPRKKLLLHGDKAGCLESTTIQRDLVLQHVLVPHGNSFSIWFQERVSINISSFAITKHLTNARNKLANLPAKQPETNNTHRPLIWL